MPGGGRVSASQAQSLALQKATLINKDDNTEFLVFHYFPESISLSTGIEWKVEEIQSGKSPEPQYKSSKPFILSMELFFNDFGEDNPRVMSVDDSISWFLLQTRPRPDQDPPPRFQLTWRQRRWLFGQIITWFITSVTIKEEMWGPDGKPIRARIDLSLLGLEVSAKGIAKKAVETIQRRQR